VKQILLVGRANLTKSLLKLFQPSSKYKITETQNLETAEQMVASGDPDFVLCTGTIQINDEGKYFLDIN